MKKFSLLSVLLCAAVAMTACNASRPKKKASETAKSGAPAGEDNQAAFTPDVNVTEASLRAGDFNAVEGLDAIFFDYDSAQLGDKALEGLKKNAEWLKKNRGQDVLVAGYCDERGTVEYNLALGQKRARQVRDYYIRLGVNGKQVATISYGKESPFCVQATEDCWSSNRRAETKIRPRTASNGIEGGKRTQ